MIKLMDNSLNNKLWFINIIYMYVYGGWGVLAPSPLIGGAPLEVVICYDTALPLLIAYVCDQDQLRP